MFLEQEGPIFKASNRHQAVNIAQRFKEQNPNIPLYARISDGMWRYDVGRNRLLELVAAPVDKK
jgi:hypothetical protein